MRDSETGLGQSKPFEIHELQQKSHFSPPELSEEEPSVNPQQQTSTKQNQQNSNQVTTVRQQQKQKSPRKRQKRKRQSQKKRITFQIPQPQLSKVAKSSQQENVNSKFNAYALIMYLSIFLYLCNFFVFIIPGLREQERISRVTEVALETMFAFFLVIMIISYEKARKIDPGYPLSLDKLYKIQNAKQAQDFPQIIQLKNKTLSLLIEKALIKQKFQKDPSQQNKELFQYIFSLWRSFEYNFCVQESKWCDKCLNIKRPRFRHCSVCDRCIERMDHHCIWLNNCVGKRNHKFFMQFLFFLIILLTFFTFVGIIEVFDSKNGVSRYVESKYGGFSKVFYIIGELLAIMLWFYYSFVFFQQLYLIFNNLTFVESLTTVLSEKKPWKKESCCDNFRQVFGSGCWVCPTKLNSNSHLPFSNQQRKKNPSVQLVQEIQGKNSNPIANFQSEHHFKHQGIQL